MYGMEFGMNGWGERMNVCCYTCIDAILSGSVYNIMMYNAEGKLHILLENEVLKEYTCIKNTWESDGNGGRTMAAVMLVMVVIMEHSSP